MKKVLRFLVKYINIKPMLKDAIDVHLEKFVMDAVAKSPTKVDDAVVPLLYAALEKEALAKVDSWDIDKMLADNEA